MPRAICSTLYYVKIARDRRSQSSPNGNTVAEVGAVENIPFPAGARGALLTGLIISLRDANCEREMNLY